MKKTLIALSVVTGLFGGAAYASLDSLMAVASCQVSDWVNLSRNGVLTTRVIGNGYDYPSGTPVRVTAIRCYPGQTYPDGTKAPNFQEYRVTIQGKGPYILNAATVQLR